MDYRRLGSTELTVSSIGMGCVTFGREIDAETSFRIVDRARDRGITLFDTAAAYGNGASECVLGEWLARRGCRSQVVLATKVSGPLTRERIIQSAEQSLKRLRTDFVDLFQLHVWDDTTPLEETLDGLQELVRQGKTRFVGCSNWTASQLSRALRLAGDSAARIESVQSPYNLVQREIERELLPLCSERNVGVIGYSPLGAGFLTGKYRRGQPVPKGTRFDVVPGHQPIYFTEHGFEVLDRLERAAQETGQSMARLALAWTLRQKRIHSVLIGARSPAQVDQAFEAESMDCDPARWQA